MPPAPDRSGYNFTGWYTVAGSGGSEFTAATTVSGNITVYARWTLDTSIQYTVTFNADGGSPATQTKTVTNGASVGSSNMPSAPAREGYSFDGWYTASGGGGSGFTADTTVTADITLYAKWLPAGTMSAYTGDGITFRMAHVSGGQTFPTGTNDKGTATVAAAYEIGETEVTYELWYTVREWAEINKGYSFSDNPGREGSSGSSQNTTPGASRQEPVTYVTWYDAVVWLNALTEWVNEKTGNSFTPVYYYDSACTTAAKNSTPANFEKEDESYTSSAYAKAGANGFRLPSSSEWELAARWRNNSTNTVSGYSSPWYTKGNSASGATADYNDATATGLVAWYNMPKTQAAKGKTANALGLYDMSGNVWEWCYDWHPSYIGSVRVMRGGGLGDTGVLRVGYVSHTYPHNRSNYDGFRPARTAE
jgi:uncharacterized repeat protein (TIGR02543 family)